MNPRAFAKAWLPPALYRAIGQASGRSNRFVPQRAGWSQAAAVSHGYGDVAILERVAGATREVLAGRAAYERDTVLFREPVYPFQLLAPLLRHALVHGDPLEVIDFGGSLGSSFRQCRPFLPASLRVRWHIIEQPLFVAAGRAEFTTDELDFHASFDELPAPESPPLLLASSVLQYLEQPLAIVEQWARSRAATLVMDRTPLSALGDDVLCLQQVPRRIYDASYPCWIFSRDRLLRRLQADWRLLAEFDCLEGRQVAAGGPAFEFKGLVLERSAA